MTTTTPAAIKLTATLRKEINAAVRANTDGFAPLAEVGFRGEGETGANALLWTEETDLDGLYKLTELRGFNADPANPGCVELDLYVTSGRGIDRELERNVCVLIRDGHVVGATSDSLTIAALKASIGFPAGRGW